MTKKLPDLWLQLNDIYIESRYPADFGALPGGQPGQNEATKALEYANAILVKLRPIVENG